MAAGADGLARAGRATGHAALLAATMLVLAGCDSLPARAVPPLPSAADFAAWSCDRIQAEAGRAQRVAVRTAYPVGNGTADAISALGDALVLYWSPLLAMRQDGIEAPELIRLKARFDALQRAATGAGCAVAAPEGSWSKAVRESVGPATGPLAVRLVYEDRGGVGGRGATTRWRMRMQLGSAVGGAASATPPVVAAEDAVAPPPWRLQPDGRLGGGVDSAGSWPQRLAAPLALGQVTAGDFVLPADSTTRARLRGQVMAFGVHRVGSEHFDAALIELFGDAPSGEAYTRVDGAMVVDRHSGLLLRLDLRSAHPVFNLHRRLVAIEPLVAVTR